ncbi:MAG TPA: DUF6036 family nucleotidyltransferase [Planctomycetota bacterium]|nr:DUF6036 family nucleotidyltransferase [Planctomycetota bacterium]
MGSDSGTELPDVYDLAFALASRFEGLGIEYAVGGAIALGHWSSPRGTADVDVTVYVNPEGLKPVFEVLRAVGGEFDPSLALRKAKERGHFAIRCKAVRIDVYVPDIPLYDDAKRRRVRVNVQGRAMWVWSAEDILLFKMLYFRAKDKIDIEQLMAVSGRALDLPYVRRHLLEAFDEQDERWQWWTATLRRHGLKP